MSNVVGIRIRQSDPIIYADPCGLELRRHKYVPVQGEQGLALDTVVRESRAVIWAQTDDRPLPRVLRISTSSDLGKLQRNLEVEDQSFTPARLERFNPAHN